MKYQRHSSYIVILISLAMTACNTQYEVSLNNQPLYTPNELPQSTQVLNSDLQGCINLAVEQDNASNAEDLTVLSCANASISNLAGISALKKLRFLDLANNSIMDLSPLMALKDLSGLNIPSNSINDIGPLIDIESLTAVNLLGNNNIPCDQLQNLKSRLGENLTAPERCSS